MASLVNLGIAGAGLATMGGIVYGSYELLKDVPRPVTELLEIKNRIVLQTDSDPEIWGQNWQKYKEANTLNEEIEVDEQQDGKAVKRKTIQRKIKEIDSWQLSDWGTQKEAQEVPLSFKEKCKEKINSEHSGIWTKSYKDFEKFCTKEKPTED